MTDSQPSSFPHKTRVDSAHGIELSSSVELDSGADGCARAAVPSSEVLSAIAGTDADASARQMRGQAMELSSYLQEKQSLLDRRESEMNARLAVLENEARVARLRNEMRLKSVAECDGPATEAETSDTRLATESENTPIKQTIDCGIALDEKTEQDVNDSIDFVPMPPPMPYKPTREVPPAERKLREDISRTRSSQQASKHRSNELPDPAASSTRELDAMRRAIEENKVDLEKRERHLQSLHDQITELHRESLELRVATEQVWTDFRGHMPDEELAKSLAQHRAKLTDHYKLANDELCRRREVLHQLQQHLGRQGEQLRRERLDMQMWIDRQRNEVDAKSASITVREFEFERREAELQRQSITWQKQREDYRHEIEQLGRRIRYASA